MAINENYIEYLNEISGENSSRCKQSKHQIKISKNWIPYQIPGQAP